MPARRRRPGLFSQWMQTYLYHRYEAKTEEDRKAAAAKDIRPYIEEHGTKLDNGNIEYRLPEPIVALGKTYYGMELRATVTTLFDYEAAKKLALDKNWALEDYGHYEFILDQDAFLVANQQGKLTDQELDSLLVDQEPTYSLWPLEKDRPDDDDTD